MHQLSKSAIGSCLLLLSVAATPLRAAEVSSAVSSEPSSAMAAPTSSAAASSTVPDDVNDNDIVKKAQQGDGNAEFALGKLYLAGGAGIGKDPAKARMLLQQAADTDVVAAMTLLGEALIEGTEMPADLPAGANLLEKASAAGDSYAADALGKLYLAGAPSMPPRPSRARELLQQASDDGILDAMTTLGQALIRGDVLPQNAVAAVGLLARPVAAGDSYA